MPTIICNKNKKGRDEDYVQWYKARVIILWNSINYLQSALMEIQSLPELGRPEEGRIFSKNFHASYKHVVELLQESTDHFDEITGVSDINKDASEDK